MNKPLLKCLPLGISIVTSPPLAGTNLGLKKGSVPTVVLSHIQIQRGLLAKFVMVIEYTQPEEATTELISTGIVDVDQTLDDPSCRIWSRVLSVATSEVLSRMLPRVISVAAPDR